VQFWHVALLATILGFVNAVDSPTRQAFVVEMVGRHDVPNAVAINSTTFNAARILGPAIAGGTIAAIGTSWAFVANAASSVAVLTALWLMRPSELHPAPPVQRARGQLVEGMRYVRRRADLVVVMVLIFVIGTFGLNFQITTALIAKQVFHRGAGGYGLLSTALALGACAGAVTATRRVKRPSQLFLVVTALAFSVSEIASGLMPSYALTALLLIPTGSIMLTLTTAANSSVQLGVDATMRGRVMALYVVCFLGGTPLGAPLVGWVAGTFGPRWGFIGGGLVCLVVTLALALVLAQRRGFRPEYLARRVSRVAHAT
jgi:MFS family permease